MKYLDTSTSTFVIFEKYLDTSTSTLKSTYKSSNTQVHGHNSVGYYAFFCILLDPHGSLDAVDSHFIPTYILLLSTGDYCTVNFAIILAVPMWIFCYLVKLDILRKANFGENLKKSGQLLREVRHTTQC